MYLFKFSKALKNISIKQFVEKNRVKSENYLKNRNLYHHRSILLNMTLYPHVFSPYYERTTYQIYIQRNPFYAVSFNIRVN